MEDLSNSQVAELISYGFLFVFMLIGIGGNLALIAKYVFKKNLKVKFNYKLVFLLTFDVVYLEALLSYQVTSLVSQYGYQKGQSMSGMA